MMILVVLREMAFRAMMVPIVKLVVIVWMVSVLVRMMLIVEIVLLFMERVIR